ncbi:MAG: PqqD family protein [Bacteroidales bacterium]|nr:PqqD family protein [Bacteroidales bacterium]
MKLKKGYRLRSLGQEFILVAEGLDAVDFSRMISMNESAAFLWKEVEDKDFDAEMLTALLTDNYDIALETAQNDVAALLESWSAAGLIEE